MWKRLLGCYPHRWSPPKACMLLKKTHISDTVLEGSKLKLT